MAARRTDKNAPLKTKKKVKYTAKHQPMKIIKPPASKCHLFYSKFLMEMKQTIHHKHRKPLNKFTWVTIFQVTKVKYNLLL